MKTLKAFLILTGLLFCLYACKKDGNTNPGSVVGRWNVVSVSSGTGAAFNNHAGNYAGQPGDYFEFTANGTLYTKEGTVLDTLNYTMNADTSIMMKFQGNTGALPLLGRITTFTAHRLVISGPYPITPGGLIDAGSSTSLSR